MGDGWGWRVWRAFDCDPERDDQGHWPALVAACRAPDGSIDVVELERLMDVLVWYRRGYS